MVDFRAVPKADRRRLQEVLRYAFTPEDGPLEGEELGEWPPSLYDQRGLYDDDTLVSTCKLYYLDAALRDGVGTIGGLGAVAVPPEHRGKGYVPTLCRRALDEFDTNGAGIVALWPFETAFYRQLGWAVANRYATCRLPPELLPDHESEGRMVELDADDWNRLGSVEAAFGEGTVLSLRRSEQWWRDRTLADWVGDQIPYVYGYERGGDLAGYLVYTVEDDEEKTLAVRDLAYTDEEAHRALLSFLGMHRAQIERIELTRRRAEAVLDRVSEPERVDCRIEVGPMCRLSSVSALEQFTWPAVDCELTIDVTDPLVDRNDWEFRLAVADGQATVRPEPERSESPDASVDVGTLSQLAVGTIDADRARELGGLEVRSGAVAAELQSLFTAQPVRLREFF